MNDANYLVLVKIGDPSGKTLKKFADLLSTVLDTEVPQSEVKQLKDRASSLDADADEEDEDSEPEAEEAVYLVKVTTK